MEIKTCPGCGSEIPASAARCKYCFHDFSESHKAKGGKLVALAGILAAMVAMGAGVMYYVTTYHSVKENVVIDEETKSIVFTRTSAEKVETDRMAFDEVDKVEVVVGGGQYEVALLLKGGDRKVINRSADQNLQPYAVHVAAVMEKTLVQKNDIAGFGDQQGTTEVKAEDLPTGDDKKSKPGRRP